MNQTRILFVDDEISVLDGLKRSLFRYRDQWHMVFCHDPQEALKLLEAEAFQVVVSDLRMPGMDGVSFLKKVRELHPKMVRFVLSGYSERGMVLDCLDVAHQYFNKPCNSELLADTINMAVRAFRHLHSERIQEKLASVRNLPTTPGVYRKLSREFSLGDPSIENVVDIVRTDPAMSAKILHFVNSAFYGFKEPISDISQATMMLGTDVIRSLVLITGIVSDAFSRVCTEAQLQQFSSHSVNVAFLSYGFAKHLGWKRELRETAFTGGLLHDVGRLLMFLAFENYLAQMGSHDMDSLEWTTRETEQFGVNHADMGAALLAVWGLPVPVIQATLFHHIPSESRASEVDIPLIVHVADVVSHTPDDELGPEMIDRSLFDAVSVDNPNKKDAIRSWLSHLRS